jgi:hypothetical protein
MSISHYSPAPYDRIVTAVTSLLWTGLIALDLFFFYIFLFSQTGYLPLGIAIVSATVALSTIILAVPFLFSPRCYKLTSTELIIQRPTRSIAIPYTEIDEISPLKLPEKGFRLAGSGGLYGYLGFFYFSDLGKVWMYVTNRNMMLLIKCTDNKRYAISPNNPDFLQDAEKRIHNHSRT